MNVDGTRIRLLERDHRMYQGEVRPFFAEVTNGSGEMWPGGLDHEPRVRLSYRLRTSTGEIVVRDGLRSPVPAPLGTGERAIVPVLIQAPSVPGRYVAAIDLVHEHVRWFNRSVVVEFDVAPRGETQRNVRRRRWPRRGQKIPRVIHQVWLGSETMPEAYRAFGVSWRQHHPDWRFQVWGDADLRALSISPALVRRAVTPAELSKVVRYQVIAEHGGVYVDTDFECLRSVAQLLGGVGGFAVFEGPGVVAPAIFGAVPEHPAIRRCAELSRRFVGVRHPESSTGPAFFTHVLSNFPDITVFPTELFYPYSWNEPQRRHDRFEDAYAVHHWAMSRR